ncbi:MAG TPA: hypothetical protein VF244_09380 [Acidimicrobiales bacterium]
MAAAPARLRIRTYNVGFGDCYLLSFHYPTGRPRHVLVDFGTTALPANRKSPTMEEIAEDIRAECAGKLDVVVATHRHTDHISGFAGPAGRIITTLDPDLVVLPWTEDPALERDATAPRPAGGGSGGSGGSGAPALAARQRAAVARLDDMHAVAGLVAKEAQRVAPLSGVPAALSAQLAFLGEENIKNKEAVVNLMNLGKKRVYAAFGTRLPIASVLPGVKVDVLGPPTLRQSKGIKRETSTDPDEFWHLAATTARTVTSGNAAPIFPRAKQAEEIPQEARWLIPKIDRMNAEELLSVVRILDEAMNNTSLILLFEVGGKLLLFPGDAQIENWRYALQDAPNAAAIRARLAGVHFYKVGHHGSLNATPRKLLWERFARLDAPVAGDRLVTLLSTRTGKHGSTTRGTEVPRTTLLKQLAERTSLVDTQDTPAREFFIDVEVDLSA